MAKLFQTGFESGFMPATSTYGVSAAETADPISGDYSVNLSSNPTYESSYNLAYSGVAAASTDALGVAMNVRIPALGSGSFLGLDLGGSYGGLKFYALADGSVMARLAQESGVSPRTTTNGTLLASSAPGVVTAGGDFHISVMGTIHNTTGICKVAINGVTVIDFTGNSSYSSGSPTIDRSVWLHSFGSLVTIYDDVIVFDDTGADWNVLPVPMKCEALRLDGQVSAQFVGSDADSVDNHLLIDEHPVSAADYVESSTVTDADFYTLANRAATGAVTTLAVIGYAENSDGGAASLKLVADSGATVSKSSALGLGASMGEVRYVLDTDPDTAAAWTDGGVNALEVGIEVA